MRSDSLMVERLSLIHIYLTKRYGNHVAVNDLNFTIDKGKVYGFMGPNGAGKSTTMNIITGCLGATEGEVFIDGHSSADEPAQAKRLIGYLPEQPPVYMDMTPAEYLDFVARAKGVPAKERATQLEAVIEKTHIQEVRKDVYKRQVVSTVALMSPVAPALSALACTLPICRISPSRGVTWSSTISHRSMQLLRRRTV